MATMQLPTTDQIASLVNIVTFTRLLFICLFLISKSCIPFRLSPSAQNSADAYTSLQNLLDSNYVFLSY